MYNESDIVNFIAIFLYNDNYTKFVCFIDYTEWQ